LRATIKHIIELRKPESGISVLKRIAAAAEISETAAGVLDLVILLKSDEFSAISPRLSVAESGVIL